MLRNEIKNSEGLDYIKMKMLFVIKLKVKKLKYVIELKARK
jgi:hypothetical protein